MTTTNTTGPVRPEGTPTLKPPPIPPGFPERWCHTHSRDTEPAPGSYLPTALAVLSATVGPRLEIKWTLTHRELCNLWVLNIGVSGSGKTSGVSALRTVTGWIREGGDDLVRLITINRISDAGLVTALDVVTGDTEKARRDNPAAEPVERDVPLAWIALFNEVAPIWTNDAASWAQEAQRALLSIYDGHLSSTTKNSPVPDQRCHVTAIGNIPPGVLRTQTTLGMLSSGFVGRWVAIPTPPPDKPNSFPRPTDNTHLLEDIRGDVSRLMALARRHTTVDVRSLWTREAEAHRDDWYTPRWEKHRRSDPDDPYAVAASELFNRLQATALKVATLVAVGRQLRDIHDLREAQVEARDTAWATMLVDQSIAYITDTLRAQGADAQTNQGRTESRVLRHLEKHGALTLNHSLTLRELAHKTKGGQVTHGDVLRAVDNLQQAGLIDIHNNGRSRRVWLTSTQENAA